MSSYRYRCRLRRARCRASLTWRAPCLRCPLTAFAAGRAGARPDHSITDHRHSLDRQSPLGDHAAFGTRGAAMDLVGRLRQLGLDHFEAAFRENKIDNTVLPGMTAESPTNAVCAEQSG